MRNYSYVNGYGESFFKGEIVFSEPYPHGGNERREIYRMPNGRYLSGVRRRDLGNVLTAIKLTDERPEFF